MAQFGPHRWSAGEYTSEHTDEFRGADFTVRDLTGARFVDCDLTGVKIVDATLVDVDISGWVQRLVVNGVDVSEFVEAELDRRHPERVQLREVRGADDFRALWATLTALWEALTARATALGEQACQQRVDGEWSYAETLRHLVFITDSWAGRTVRDEELPYHRLGLPQTAYPRADAAALGIDVDATPSFGEVLEARTERQAQIQLLLDTLADADLGRPCLRTPAPGYPEEERPVWACLAVVMEEECEHYRFARRDIETLERG